MSFLSSSSSTSCTVTAQTLINQVMTLLGQAQNAPIGTLPDGVTGTPVITTNDQIIIFLNQAQNDLARYCLPIKDYASVVISSGDILPPYSLVASSSGRALRVPINLSRSVSSSSLNPLTPARAGDFNNAFYNWYPADSNGNPTAYADQTTGVVLASPVTTSTTFVVSGYYLPWQLYAVTDCVDYYLNDFAQRIIYYTAATRIAMKNIDNPDVASRLQVWMGDAHTMMQTLYDQMLQADPSLVAWFPGIPPVGALFQVGKQFTAQG